MKQAIFTLVRPLLMPFLIAIAAPANAGAQSQPEPAPGSSVTSQPPLVDRQQQPPTAESEGAPQRTARLVGSSNTIRNHDGFYLAMAFGLGALSGDLTYSLHSYTRSILGAAANFELAMGGTPLPGLVIGGGLFGIAAHTPYYSWEWGQKYRMPGGSVFVAMLGPFVDFYPYPERGLHFQFTAGPARVSVGDGEPQRLCYDGSGCEPSKIPSTPYKGYAFGAATGMGYTTFVSSQWSLGVLFQVMYTKGKLSPNDKSAIDFWFSTLSPGLLLTATFH